MTDEENRRIVEEYVKAWTKGDTQTLERLVHDRHRIHAPPPGISPDKKGQIEMSRLYSKAFPDLKVNIKKWVAQGDDVCVRLQVQGTHRGEFMGTPPSNNKTELDVLLLVTVQDGQILEDLTAFDTLGLMTQIGAVPEMSTAAR